MADLISRAAVLAAIDHERNILIEQGRFGAEHVVVHHARRLIEELPTVDDASDDGITLDEFVDLLKHSNPVFVYKSDMVNVVRCRDCKFYYGVNEECGCNGGYHSEDWYCANGERREDKKNESVQGL